MRFTLPLNPVPASRPRVTRSGHVYYPKRYTAFRKEAESVVPVTLRDEQVLDGPLLVRVTFRVQRPKKTSLLFPRGDTDNYVKAVLDALNGHAYVDDNQVIRLTAVKCWAEPDEPGSIKVNIRRKP